MNKISKLALATSISLLLANTAWADADIAIQSGGAGTEATANVDLEVVVPEILIFGIGETGNNIAKLSWAVSPAGAHGGTDLINNATYTGAVGAVGSAAISTANALTITNGGTGALVAADVGTLRVFLFSNEGSDVTITSQTTAGVGGGGTVGTLSNAGGNTIPIADFTITTPTAGVTNPGLGSTADTAHTGGIVNIVGTWAYQFTGSTPAAGTHSGRVRYVAAQP